MNGSWESTVDPVGMQQRGLPLSSTLGRNLDTQLHLAKKQVMGCHHHFFSPQEKFRQSRDRVGFSEAGCDLQEVFIENGRKDELDQISTVR